MITDTEARKIAAEWHGGGGTALYAFASTGAINTARTDHQLAGEVYENILDERRRIGTDDPNPNNPEHIGLWDLEGLRVYVKAAGPRGPVPGWADLTW